MATTPLISGIAIKNTILLLGYLCVVIIIYFVTYVARVPSLLGISWLMATLLLCVCLVGANKALLKKPKWSIMRIALFVLACALVAVIAAYLALIAVGNLHEALRRPW